MFFERLNLKMFKDVEIVYLKEYVAIFKPLAVALDRLQGNNSYYGQSLPTLFTLKRKLEDLELSNFRYCEPLLRSIKTSLQARFSNHFALSSEVNEAIIAASTHPFFKLRWLTVDNNEDTKKRIQDIVMRAAKQFNCTPSANDNESTDDEWFLFDDSKTPDGNQASNATELEVMQFFQDKSKHLGMLQAYPAVRQLFLRSNTSITSNGPVKRLFSFAGFIHSPRRQALSDELFEKLVFLKGNSGLQR